LPAIGSPRKESDLSQGYEYRERARKGAAGTNLLQYLAERYPHSTPSQWRERLDAGQVVVNGMRVGPDVPLREGQELVWRRPPWIEPAAPLAFALLFRDSQVLAVLKPSGLPTLPGGGYLEHTLLARVRGKYPEASPLHRLGRATSGIVLFARTPTAARLLTASWRRGEVRKVYRALTQGVPRENEFTVEAAIGPVPHPLLGSVHAAHPSGRNAASRVTVLERRESTALVEVEIATGRPHQIRIHLSCAGFPLAGDPLYGAGGNLREGPGALPGGSGYLLHARLLAFRHPGTGATVEVVAPPPAALRDARGT